jgi:hypothetical protein
MKNEQIRQVVEAIMTNDTPRGVAGEIAFNRLSGWLTGYLAGNDGIDAEHQLTILKKVREFQNGI